MQIVCNGERRDTLARNVAELLAELRLAERPVAVEINREVTPRAQHAERVLQEGDCIEIVTLVGGG